MYLPSPLCKSARMDIRKACGLELYNVAVIVPYAHFMELTHKLQENKFLVLPCILELCNLPFTCYNLDLQFDFAHCQCAYLSLSSSSVI